MTKLIITILLVGLLGVVAPQIYYHASQVPIQAFTPETHEKTVVKKNIKKKIINNNVEIPLVTTETKEFIEDIFDEEAEKATAIFMHESGLVLNRKGWNCHYYRKDGTRYSKSCNIEDRPLAWSVDCGITQINVKGKTCPAKLLTLEGNMEAARKIYKTQGLGAWVSYTSGAYLKFMNS